MSRIKRQRLYTLPEAEDGSRAPRADYLADLSEQISQHLLRARWGGPIPNKVSFIDVAAFCRCCRAGTNRNWFVARELGLPADIVNVEGGTIAHGHPIGATGAVLTTRLIHSMHRDGLKRGIVTLCIGGGQGIALALEILA